jgi:hypothetical protein
MQHISQGVGGFTGFLRSLAELSTLTRQEKNTRGFLVFGGHSASKGGMNRLYYRIIFVIILYNVS